MVAAVAVVPENVFCLDSEVMISLTFLLFVAYGFLYYAFRYKLNVLATLLLSFVFVTHGLLPMVSALPVTMFAVRLCLVTSEGFRRNVTCTTPIVFTTIIIFATVFALPSPITPNEDGTRHRCTYVYAPGVGARDELPLACAMLTGALLVGLPLAYINAARQWWIGHIGVNIGPLFLVCAWQRVCGLFYLFVWRSGGSVRTKQQSLDLGLIVGFAFAGIACLRTVRRVPRERLICFSRVAALARLVCAAFLTCALDRTVYTFQPLRLAATFVAWLTVSVYFATCTRAETLRYAPPIA
jgi:hypothetical protein